VVIGSFHYSCCKSREYRLPMVFRPGICSFDTVVGRPDLAIDLARDNGGDFLSRLNMLSTN
jgi:hypothetical protein